jgi:hypothetical protein
MEEGQEKTMDFKVDRTNLYREESFTDLKVGSIRRLTPVKPDGSEDRSRKTLFVAQTNVLTPNGPLPIQGIIQAKELQQAIKKFPEAIQTAMDHLIEEAKKHKQKEESRIIVPGR